MTARICSPKSRSWAVVASCAAVLVAATFVGVPGQAQARTMLVTPDEQLVDGQYVDVALTGFEPGRYVRVRLCAQDAAGVSDCAKDENAFNAPGRSRIALPGPDGKASTPFVIKALDIDKIGGGKFQCDAESPCKLIAFDLDDSGNKEIGIESSVATALAFAGSTLPCVESEPRVAGSGASSIRAAVVEWQAETCRPPMSLNVSYATANSVNGIQAFVGGLTDADFAMSGIPLTADERQTLADRKVQPLHIPVGLGSLVLAYNLWYDKDGDQQPDQITDLQLSPQTLAGIMTGQVSSWSDPAITADNLENYPDGFRSKAIRPVARADNSAATWWLLSWFCALAQEEWEKGGAEAFRCPAKTIFPAGNGVNLFTGTDKVALQIREFAGEQGTGGIPDGGLIGFVYNSEALKIGLPVVALRNAAGEYVKPTEQSVTAAAAAGAIDADGVFTPNFHSGGPGAYPLPVVTYAIVPAADTALKDPQEQLLMKFLDYVVGDGQEQATQRGYAPLPEAMAAKSRESIAKVYKTDAAAAPSPTAAPSSAPTVTGAQAPVAQATPAPATSPSATSAPSNQAAAGTGTTTQDQASSETSGAPVVRSVAGLIKLLSGSSAPIAVSELFFFGAILAILGRALSIVVIRHRLAKLSKPVDASNQPS